MKNNRLSTFIIVYNEQNVIQRCLESVKNISDEIIVIHDGNCSDHTLDIARKYTSLVYERQHSGFCESHRIEAINLATGNWLLQIDADEFLSDEAIDKIPQLIKNDFVDGYSFIWKLWDGKKYITETFPHKNILFRKEKMYYIAFPHTEMSTYGSLQKTDLHLEHQPAYNNYTLKTFRKKWIKWIKLHALFIINNKFETFNTSKELIDKLKNRNKKQILFSGYIFAPIWFVYAFIKMLFVKKMIRNITGWKVAFMQGTYAFFLCLEIKRTIKNERN